MDLKILQIASDTTYMNNIGKFTHHAKKKNTYCGDKIFIKLYVENNVIKNIGYETKSCVYCQASASLLSKKIINKNIKKTKKVLSDISEFYNNSEYLFKNSLNKIFNKKNYKRKECLYLPVKTILYALKNN